jgi:hypothetical protein
VATGRPVATPFAFSGEENRRHRVSRQQGRDERERPGSHRSPGCRLGRDVLWPTRAYLRIRSSLRPAGLPDEIDKWPCERN